MRVHTQHPPSHSPPNTSTFSHQTPPPERTQSPETPSSHTNMHQSPPNTHTHTPNPLPEWILPQTPTHRNRPTQSHRAGPPTATRPMPSRQQVSPSANTPPPPHPGTHPLIQMTNTRSSDLCTGPGRGEATRHRRLTPLSESPVPTPAPASPAAPGPASDSCCPPLLGPEQGAREPGDRQPPTKASRAYRLRTQTLGTLFQT